MITFILPEDLRILFQIFLEPFSLDGWSDFDSWLGRNLGSNRFGCSVGARRDGPVGLVLPSCLKVSNPEPQVFFYR